ncbi:MAG: response regulator [Polyangiaceae bacterium]|nr:response regulator [Polyangiaceae bacterium]
MTTTLLAVDDSKTMRRVLEITFSGEEEFRTVLAASAQEALEKLRSERPAVVLLDANLGEQSGYDLCQEIKRETPSVGVILLSSKQQPYDRARGASVGSDDFIDKPFDTQLMVDKVVALTQNKAAPQPVRLVAAAPAPVAVPAPAATPAAERPRPAPPVFGATLPGVARPPVPARPAGAPAPAGPLPPVAAATPAKPVAPAQPAPPPTRTIVSSAMTAAPQPPRPYPNEPELPLVEPTRPAAAPRTEPVAAPPAAPAPAAPVPTAPAAAAPPAPVAPVAAPMQAAAAAGEAAMAPKLQELGLTPEQAAAVLSLSRDLVEKVVWEVVPVLAETMIREEIQRLTSE